MEWTFEVFGERAALRYDALIKQALKDITRSDVSVSSSNESRGMVVAWVFGSRKAIAGKVTEIESAWRIRANLLHE